MHTHFMWATPSASTSRRRNGLYWPGNGCGSRLGTARSRPACRLPCRQQAVLLFAVAISTAAMAGAAQAEAQESSPLRQASHRAQSGKLAQSEEIFDMPRDQLICFALYTVEDETLKLSSQLYPLRAGEAKTVTLEILKAGNWQRVAESGVDEEGWLATFRVEDWDHTRSWQYRVSHAGGSNYTGTIRRDPIDKEEIVIAAFTGNSNRDIRPRTDIVANIQAQDPDLLFFSGDQVYDHKRHTEWWLRFGRQFGEIIRDRPTVTIPDDHDVGQPNLWGAGGGVATLPGASDGGYLMPASYVKMVERAQTSHLPDPYDPAPIRQGIGVYYTSLHVGGIDFAILEDRKFKTGPYSVIPQQGPRPDHVNDPNYDRASVDVPEAQLLGERQLRFLAQWGRDWDKAEMKVVLSQTIFAGGAHIHGGKKGRLLADLDSNGWPQSGRARAVIAMRKAFALHIAGDQHLATVLQHGVHDWEDSTYSFCVPSIVNFYKRWWHPLEAPLRHDANNPLPFTGRYYDGFGNKVTMHAYSNPTDENFNAAGYGLVRFHKPSRKMTLECWPRHVDVQQPDAQQFPGWPITIQQTDNYGRQPIGYLPTLEITAAEANPLRGPVVEVIDEQSGTLVYALRIRGRTWQPKVFTRGTYTVRIGNTSDDMQTLPGLVSQETNERILQVRL